MTARRLRPRRMLIGFVVALLISWAVVYLVEYFGWPLLSEAGGVI